MNKIEMTRKLAQDLQLAADYLEKGDLSSLIEYFKLGSVSNQHIPSLLFPDKGKGEKRIVAEELNKSLISTNYYLEVNSEGVMEICHKVVPVWVGIVDLTKSSFTFEGVLSKYITSKENHLESLEFEITKLKDEKTAIKQEMDKKFFKGLAQKSLLELDSKIEETINLVTLVKKELNDAKESWNEINKVVVPLMEQNGLTFDINNTK